MANNESLNPGGEQLLRSVNYRFILVQVFVSLFLCINVMLITTFFMKEVFYTTMRYILFAVTLLSDCLILIVSNFLLILRFYFLTIQMWLCITVYLLSSIYIWVTAWTLTAMTLERYVAICMSLRHGELSSTRNTMTCIFIIHGLSSVPSVVNLLVFFASASPSYYKQPIQCSVEIFTLHTWQGHLRSAISQFYFLIMLIAIVFSYIKIMKASQAASGDNKKSSMKGLRTVVLHGFQLLLCLMQLWFPFIENAILQIDFMLYINIQYCNYIAFTLTPRCLSPLIYGLRDEKVFLALKYYILCGVCRKSYFFNLTN